MNYTTILLATDFSDKSAAAEKMALDLAKQSGAKLCVISAVEPILGVDHTDASEFSEFYDKLVDRMSFNAKTRETAWNERDVNAEFNVEIGERWKVILDTAEKVDADVIVLGRRQYSGDIPIGTTSQKVFFGTTRPTLFVPTK